jgi:Zn-dependent oligopeptidase
MIAFSVVNLPLFAMSDHRSSSSCRRTRETVESLSWDIEELRDRISSLEDGSRAKFEKIAHETDRIRNHFIERQSLDREMSRALISQIDELKELVDRKTDVADKKCRRKWLPTWPVVTLLSLFAVSVLFLYVNQASQRSVFLEWDHFIQSSFVDIDQRLKHLEKLSSEPSTVRINY